MTRTPYRLTHKDEIAQQKRAYRLAHKDEIAEQKRAYRLAHKTEIVQSDRAYRLAHKDEISEQKRAYRLAHKDEISEWKRAHKDEIAEQKRAYYLAYKTEIAQQMRAYYLAHPEVFRKHKALRRARKMTNGPYESIEFDTVWFRDRGYCGLCGGFCPWDSDWHLDHIVPLSRGGTHTWSNVQVSHKSCNLRKGARLGGQA